MRLRFRHPIIEGPGQDNRMSQRQTATLQFKDLPVRDNHVYCLT